MKFKIIALIPSRSGSERIKNKNIVKLGKKHLIGYAIKDYIITDTSSVSSNILKSSGEYVSYNLSNEITLNSLSDGTYSSCTIKITDNAGNNSNILLINNLY